VTGEARRRAAHIHPSRSTRQLDEAAHSRRGRAGKHESRLASSACPASTWIGPRTARRATATLPQPSLFNSQLALGPWQPPAPRCPRDDSGRLTLQATAAPPPRRGLRPLGWARTGTGRRASSLSAFLPSPSATLARFSHLVIAGVFRQIPARSCAETAGRASRPASTG